MKDYSIPSDVLHREIFRKHPERIAWLVKLLDVCNEDGVIEMSYQEVANMLVTTKGSATKFLSHFIQSGNGAETDGKRIVLCVSNSYVSCGNASETMRKRKEDEKKPKRVSKKTKETTLFARVRAAFEDFVKEHFEEAYYWTPKDAVACNRLIKEITFSRANRPNPLPVDDEGILEGFTSYINSINDKWVLEHFSMAIITQSFQQIRQQISLQNGKSITTETPKKFLIKRQKQSIVDKVSEIELRWKQSQGEGAEED